MRICKRKRLWVPLLLIIIFVCFCIIIIYSIRLEKTGYRDGEYKLTGTQKSIIDSECAGISDIDDLIDKCGKLVCKQLRFTHSNDLNNGQANCVGYAKFHAAILNHAFRINRISNRARRVYGKVCLWGIDLHPLFKTVVPKKYESFLNDHDYTEIDMGKEYLYIDSSIQDLFGYEYSETVLKN